MVGIGICWGGAAAQHLSAGARSGSRGRGRAGGGFGNSSGQKQLQPPATTPAGSQEELPNPKKSCRQLWARDRATAPRFGLLWTWRRALASKPLPARGREEAEPSMGAGGEPSRKSLSWQRVSKKIWGWSAWRREVLHGCQGSLGRWISSASRAVGELGWSTWAEVTFLVCLVF